MKEIGLFPLGMVLLPHERVPLHIFEDRYKELIQECVDTEQPFGLILAEEDELADVGTLARVEDVTRRFPDGRMNILIEGLGRFSVVEMTDGRSFATASISELADADIEATGADTEALFAAFVELAEAADAEAPTVSTEEDPLSFRLATLVELENFPRQQLLELDSEGDRTRYLTKLFSDLKRSITRQAHVRGRAESNGRVDSRD